MLFIFDMGGVVTNTFRMDSIYNKLNLSKTEYYEICSLNNRNIGDELNIGKITTKEFWQEFNNRSRFYNSEKPILKKIINSSYVSKRDLVKHDI